MKKGILIILISLILLSGCGDKNNSKTSDDNINKTKTLTCTKTETDEDGYNTTDTMEITYENNKILKVKETNESEMDPDMIDLTYGFGTLFASAFNTIDGLQAKYTKENDNIIKFTIEVDYTKFDVNKLKEALGSMYDEEANTIYSTNDITLEEFKTKNLDGYTCN